MGDIREMVNPHDKITLLCTDIDAARLAVLFIGNGRYCIDNDEMPIFIFGGSEKWIEEKYSMPFDGFVKSISSERLIVALRSFRAPNGVSSTVDPVSFAHKLADRIEKSQIK